MQVPHKPDNAQILFHEHNLNATREYKLRR